MAPAEGRPCGQGHASAHSDLPGAWRPPAPGLLTETCFQPEVTQLSVPPRGGLFLPVLKVPVSWALKGSLPGITSPRAPCPGGGEGPELCARSLCGGVEPTPPVACVWLVPGVHSRRPHGPHEQPSEAGRPGGGYSAVQGTRPGVCAGKDRAGLRASRWAFWRAHAAPAPCAPQAAENPLLLGPAAPRSMSRNPGTESVTPKHRSQPPPLSACW